MKKNISIEDRIIRFVLFDGLLGFTLAGLELSVFWHYTLFVLSMYLLFTIIIGYSPFYHLLGIDTNFSEPKNGSTSSAL